MPVLRVGERYHAARGDWPEGAQFNWRSGQLELLLFFTSPTAAEVEAVRAGRARVGVWTDDRSELIILVYQFNGLPTGDAPYCWHLVPKAERTRPDPLVGPQRHLLQIVLVDATTGIVRALRLLSLSPRVSQALMAAIRAQAARSFERAHYDRALAAVYQRSSSEDLAREAIIDPAGI